jgi:hypothetical protein
MEARNAIAVLIAAAPTPVDTAIIANVIGETAATTSEPRSRELHKVRPAPFRIVESQLANPGVKGSRANSGSVVTIVLPKTKVFRNDPCRLPGVLY